MSKLASLQSALNSSSGRTTSTPVTVETRATVVARPKSNPVSSREGKENIAAWLPVEFKRSIRLVQAKVAGDPSLQTLMAEALNDLFTKYNVPTVNAE